MQVLLQQNQKTSVHAAIMWLGGILYVVWCRNWIVHM